MECSNKLVLAALISVILANALTIIAEFKWHCIIGRLGLEIKKRA